MKNDNQENEMSTEMKHIDKFMEIMPIAFCIIHVVKDEDGKTADIIFKYANKAHEKLEGVSNQWELKTVWGVGYKFDVKES